MNLTLSPQIQPLEQQQQQQQNESVAANGIKQQNRNSRIIYSYPNDTIDKVDQQKTVYTQKMNPKQQPHQLITYSSTTNPSRRLSLNTSNKCSASSSSSSAANSSSPNHYSNSANFTSGQPNDIYVSRLPTANAAAQFTTEKIYQSAKRVDAKPNHKNYLNSINKLIDENNEIYFSNNQAIYEEQGNNEVLEFVDERGEDGRIGGASLIKIGNYQELNRVGSFHHRNKQRNEHRINDLLRTNSINTNKPIPPSRTSSLQYRLNPKSMSMLIKSKNLNEMPSERCTLDRNSIYSTFSLRNHPNVSSRLSSFNLDSFSNQLTHHELDANLLSKNDLFKIESCYKSIGSSVYSASCLADFYSTNLECLIKLLDWTHQVRGVPVWVFNTGLNPKRPKGLSLIMADKRTGLANWRLNNITYLNDFKWTKPGHITFKIYAGNLLLSESLQTVNKSTLKRKNQNRPLSHSSTLNEFRMSSSGNAGNGDGYLNNSFNEISSEFEMFNSLSKNKESFVFAALKFDNEFECSKFYDFYRSLFVDSKNDDLFNPHFKASTAEKSSKASGVRVCLKKITKSSISSPCAFHHINSLSIVDENEFSSSSSSSASSSSSSAAPLNSLSDTQSLNSEVTNPNSLNNSSILTNNYSNKK